MGRESALNWIEGRKKMLKALRDQSQEPSNYKIYEFALNEIKDIEDRLV